MAESYDCIIIGSGTSGGAAAFYLQESGAKCLLLEAGQYFKSDTYPPTEFDYTGPMFWGGGIELDDRGKMGFLRGKCVGGGSIVNQGLMDRFDDLAFDDWRADTDIGFFSTEAMAPYYDDIESHIALQTIPPEWRNRSAEIFIEGMEKTGHQWGSLRRGQCDCGTEEGNDCMACLGGCHRDSKQSTMVTFIRKAEALGLAVWAETSVEHITATRHGVKLHVRKRGEPMAIEAPHVVLAAGSFGTTQLLMRSGLKDKLPALGTGFANHPQFMSFAIYDEEINAHRGAFQSVKSDDPEFRRKGFKLENVFAPPISLSMLYPSFGPGFHDYMRSYRNMACMEVCIRDDNLGTMKLRDGGQRLAITKPLSAQDEKRAQDGLKIVYEIYAATGAKQIFQSPFQFGLHLMGGCPIGVNPARSVVNERFEVHGEPRLHCADTSTFPNAPGINPALTVMAMTRKMVEGMLN